MQRSIVATMLVQIYAQLSYETDKQRRDEVRKDLELFLADRHKDLDVSKISAAELSSRRGEID